MIWAYLMAGLTLGLSAGLAPGPMAMLAMAEGLHHWRRGVAVAFAPLVSDLPILLLSQLALAALPRHLFGWVETAGGAVLLWYAYGTVQGTRLAPTVATAACGTARRELADALRRATVVNFLNPNPWIFYFTAGGTLLAGARAVGPAAVTAFLSGMYVLLVGLTALLGALAGMAAPLLGTRGYRVALAVAACGLAALAARSIWSGLHSAGLIG